MLSKMIKNTASFTAVMNIFDDTNFVFEQLFQTAVNQYAPLKQHFWTTFQPFLHSSKSRQANVTVFFWKRKAV